jgi:hypothetical protein
LLPAEKTYIALPMLSAIVLFLLFSIILKSKIDNGLFGELGFVYLSLAVAYTVLPAFILFMIDFGDSLGWLRFSSLLSSPTDVARHLWRHNIFIFGVAFGYLIFRGKQKAAMVPLPTKTTTGRGEVIVFIMGALLLSITGITILSAPVSSYIDHYTRFDHLSWLTLRIVYILLILKTGSYFILMYYLFCKYHKYKYLILFVIPAICIYEISYSYGSRIEALSILLAALGLYQYLVKPIKWRNGIISLAIIAALFTIIEYARSESYNGTPADNIDSTMILPAAEFGAVFFSGFHLYSERNNHALPDHQWQMFFSDIISLIPFFDHTKWNPQYWYARNYFPDAIVPPETLGPIADSAVWGGEYDLLLRSFINGGFFALIAKLFVCSKSKWWKHVTYIYVYSTCILTLKYSIFYCLTLLFSNLLPALILIGIANKIIPSYKYRRPIKLV